MAVPKPGEFITAKCGRCNDVTGHVVMLVLDGVVAKVECKACGSVHKYRETRLPGAGKKQQASVRHVRAGQNREQGKDLGPAPRSSRPASATGTGAPRRSSAAAKLESAWQEAMVRHSAETPVPYAMANAYSIRDFLDHPVFGRGEVVSVTAPDKMDVLFQDGMKTLRCKV